MNEDTKRAAFFAGGVIVGGVATYFVVRKRFEEHYSQIATDEIASMRAYYAKKKDDLEQESADQKYKTKLEDLGYWSDTERPSPNDLNAEQVEQETVETESNWDEEMLVMRDDGSLHISEVGDPDRDFSKPHLITQDEYDEEEVYTKIHVTYYEEDGVLTDHRDYVIEDVETVLGRFSPSNFGHIPDDPDIVLIRNPRLKADYEVSKDAGSYNETVLGVTKPRRDDE